MADWTDITDARLEPGKPARSIEALALRDNPIAIAEGAEGAPRLTNNQSASVLPEITASTEDADIFLRNDAEQETERSDEATGPWHTVAVFNIAQNGSVNVFLQYRSSSGLNPFAEYRIIKNGSVVQTASTTSASYQSVNRTENVEIGDVITVQFRRATVGGVTGSAFIRNIRLRATGAFITWSV